jgi:hypothetical protein
MAFVARPRGSRRGAARHPGRARASDGRPPPVPRARTARARVLSAPVEGRLCLPPWRPPHRASALPLPLGPRPLATRAPRPSPGKGALFAHRGNAPRARGAPPSPSRRTSFVRNAGRTPPRRGPLSLASEIRVVRERDRRPSRRGPSSFVPRIPFTPPTGHRSNRADASPSPGAPSGEERGTARRSPRHSPRTRQGSPGPACARLAARARRDERRLRATSSYAAWTVPHADARARPGHGTMRRIPAMALGSPCHPRPRAANCHEGSPLWQEVSTRLERAALR